jgi:uncharacterized protein YcfL
MKRISWPTFLVVAAVGFFSGCALTEAGMVVRSTGGAGGPKGYEVDTPSPELASMIRVTRAVPKNDGGERVAQIDVENFTQAPVKLEYQFRWRDRFGSELISLWDWRNITIPASRTVRLEDEAIDSEWVHYTCEIRLRK